MKGISRCAFSFALACGLVASARAQAPHAIPPLVRPLHERVAEADAIALVAVERVTAGRISLRLRDALHGELPAALELKRSPLAPPPLAEGAVALVMLRGARSPYVLAGEPSEALVVHSDVEAEALAQGVLQLRAAGGDPLKTMYVYGTWLNAPEPLRSLGRAVLEKSAADEIAPLAKPELGVSAH
ncbi:MAG: hypothetical protein FJ091_21250 [Deltaproteobacteria bacterium]|nr:hypothetical protein [Deltaproteobacteria bacterium]